MQLYNDVEPISPPLRSHDARAAGRSSFPREDNAGRPPQAKMYDEIEVGEISSRVRPVGSGAVQGSRERTSTMWQSPPMESAVRMRRNIPPARTVEVPPLPPARRFSSASSEGSRPMSTVSQESASSAHGVSSPPIVPTGGFYELPQVLVKITVDPRIEKEDADNLIARAGLMDGMYVLRESRSHPGCYVLCVCYHGRVLHYPIERCEGQHKGSYVLLCPNVRHRFEDLAHIVDFYSKPTQDGIITPLTERVEHGSMHRNGK